MHLEPSSGKWLPSCLGHIYTYLYIYGNILNCIPKILKICLADSHSDSQWFRLHPLHSLLIYGVPFRLFITGGILFVVAPYMTEDGQYDGATKGGRNLFLTMHTIWKQLYREGKSQRWTATVHYFHYLHVLTHIHRQNDHRFTENIYTCISWMKSYVFWLNFLLKFVPKGPIHNRPVLVQVMAWRQTGGKPLPEVMLTQFTDAYMRHLGIWDARNSFETSLSQHGIKKTVYETLCDVKSTKY